MMYKLENDLMCGITTGGKEECEWDCEVAFGESLIGIVFTKFTNPQCLRDCFPSSHCVNNFLDDLSSNQNCSAKTEAELKEITTCIANVFLMSLTIFNTINLLVSEVCPSASLEWFCFQESEILANYGSYEACIEQNSTSRLTPIFQVDNSLLGGAIRTNLDFENTKHRYSWICSLRSRRQDQQHFCGVTLLRRPPGCVLSSFL